MDSGKESFGGPLSPCSKLLVDEEYTCEHCNTSVAVIACTGCLMDPREPFYYCKSCCDMIHVGNRKCVHPLSQLVNVSELKNEVQGTVELIESVNSIDKDSIEKIQQIMDNTTTKSENMAAECRYLFNDLRILLDSKEKELLSQCESVKDKCLEAGKSETERLKNRIESSLQTKQELVSLMELPSEQLKDNIQSLTDKAKQVKYELSVPIVSTLLELMKELSFLPDTVNIKDPLMRYCIPYHRDWREGDTVPVGAPTPNIDTQGHFWLHEPAAPVILTHLALISHTLTNMITSSKVRSSSESFSCGDVCAVFFPQDQLWHRGLVEKIISLDKGITKFVVRYMDYGNIEELYGDCVAALPPVLLSYPFQCRRCRFTEDTSISWGLYREAKWRYTDLTNKKTLAATVSNKVVLPHSSYPLFTVKLFNAEGVDIGQNVLELAKETANKPKESYFMASRDIRYTSGGNRKTTKEEKGEADDSISSQDGLLGSHPSTITLDMTPPIDHVTTPIEQVTPPTDESLSRSIEVTKDSLNEEGVGETEENDAIVDDKHEDEGSVVLEETEEDVAMEKEKEQEEEGNKGVAIVKDTPTVAKKEIVQEKDGSSNEQDIKEEDVANVDEFTDPPNDESSIAPSTIDETPPTDNETPPIVNETVPIVTDAQPIVTEAPPISDEAPPTDNKTPPTNNETPPIVSEAMPTSDEALPTVTEAPLIVTFTEATRIKNVLTVTNEALPITTPTCTSPFDITSPPASSAYSSSPTDHTHSDTSRPIDTDEDISDYDNTLTTLHVPSSCNVKVHYESDTPTEESEVAMAMGTSISEVTTPPNQLTTQEVSPKVTTPPLTTPNVSSLPKLALDLGTDLSSADVVGVVSGDSNGYLHPSIEEGAKLGVTICTSLDSEGHFWCQLILDDKECELYSNLFDKLQEHADTKGQYTPVFFNPGDMCLAVFSEDSQWYRGLVESTEEEDKLRIRFIDYGNVENVPVPNTMGLKSEYRQLPFQSFQCSLATETKDTFTEKECQRFDEFVQCTATATVVSISDDDHPIVSVNISVKAQLEKEGEEKGEQEKEKDGQEKERDEQGKEEQTDKGDDNKESQEELEKDKMEGDKEIDVFLHITSQLSPQKLRTYSFEMPLADDSSEGLTWAERTERDLCSINSEVHSDSDLFTKPKKVTSGFATDVDDVWIEDETPPTSGFKKSDSSGKRSKEAESKFKYRHTSRPSFNTSGISKYLGHRDSKNDNKMAEEEKGDEDEGVTGGRGRGKGKGKGRKKGRGGKEVAMEKEDKDWRDDTDWREERKGEDYHVRGRGGRGRGTTGRGSFERGDSYKSRTYSSQSTQPVTLLKRRATTPTATPPPSRPHSTSSSSSTGFRDNSKRSQSPNKVEVVSLLVGHIPSSYTEKRVADGFQDHGYVYDVRKVFKNGRCLFFVDMEKNDAYRAKADLNGIRVEPGAEPMYLGIDFNSYKWITKRK